ncbi:MAG TPA: alpha/beta hydrolase [Pseudomonadales bacterium]|nr:alpha/beta hydrolase [Pseudomonadales bacterium]
MLNQAINRYLKISKHTYHYGEHGRHKMDVFIPSKPVHGKRPVLIFYYGGTWSAGRRDMAIYSALAQSFAHDGYIVCLPDYRIYPEVKFPAFIYDAAEAFRYVSESAEKWGGDSEHIFIMGHSAGAHIAAMLALDVRYLGEALLKKVQGVIGLAGPYDFLPYNTKKVEDIFSTTKYQEESQPIHFVHENTPPFLLLHGGKDRVVGPGNSKRLSTKFKSLNRPVRTVYFSKLDHYTILFSMLKPFGWYSHARKHVLRFLREIRLQEFVGD